MLGSKILLVCSVAIVQYAGDVGFASLADVKGTLIRSNSSTYYVDFTEGLKEYDATLFNIVGTKTTISKDKCVQFE